MQLLYPSNLENIKLLYKKSSGMKGKHHTPETKEKLKIAAIKQWKDPEVREIARQSLIGKKHSPEQREKNRQAQIKRYKDPKEREKISQGQIKRYKDPLQREKNRQAQIKRYKNLEEREKQRKSHLGNKNVGNHWKMSDEAKEKLRQKNLGKKLSQETREKLRQKNLGKKLSQEHKEKLRQSQLHMFSALDHLCKDKYCILFNDRLKEKVRERDSHICQKCGAIQNGKRHTVHHIHYDKPNCYPDLICLCNSCNLKANRNKEYWESFFMNKLNERGLLFWTKCRNKQIY